MTVVLKDAQSASTISSASVSQHVVRRKDKIWAKVVTVDLLIREVCTVASGVASLVAPITSLADAIGAPYYSMYAAVNRLKNLLATEFDWTPSWTIHYSPFSFFQPILQRSPVSYDAFSFQSDCVPELKQRL